MKKGFLLKENAKGGKKKGANREPAPPHAASCSVTCDDITQTSVQITWSKQTDTVWLHVVEYSLEVDLGSTGKFKEVVRVPVEGERRFVLTGLTPGTAVECRVVPLSELISSGKADEEEPTESAFLPSSVSSCCTLAAPPPALDPPALASRAKTWLKVKWKAPVSDHGSPITQYTLEVDKASYIMGGEQMFFEEYTGLDKAFKIGGMAPGSSYGFRVRCRNALGQSPQSEVVFYKTSAAVAMITEAPAMTACTPTSITIAWDVPTEDGGSPVTEYSVEMSKEGPSREFRVVYYGADLACTASDLELRTAYAFRLVAINDVGKSVPSPVCVFSTDDAAPSAPSAPVLFKAAQTSLVLRWRGAPDSRNTSAVESYRVFMGKKCVYEGVDAEAKISDLQPGSSYTFTVRAINGKGESDPSPRAKLQTSPGCPLPPAIVSAAKVTSGVATLAWSASSGQGAEVHQYVVERTWEDGTEMHEVLPAKKKNTLRIDGLSPATTYTCRVLGVNSVGSGAWSEPLDVTTESSSPDICGPPALLATTRSSLALEWPAAVANGLPITQYVLGMEENHGGGLVKGFDIEVEGDEPQYTCSDLNAQCAFRFRVHAVNEHGKARWSSWSGWMTVAPGPPSRPEVPRTVASTASSVTIAWTSAPHPEAPLVMEPLLEYVVEADRGEGFAEVGRVRAEGPELHFTIEGLEEAEGPRARIRAVSGVGVSPACKAVALSTKAVPPAPPPAPRAESIAPTSIKLAWKAPSSDGGGLITGYRVMCAAMIGGEEAEVYKGSGLSCTVADLEPRTEYMFAVAASNEAGWGLPSPDALFTTSVQPPKAPSAPEVVGTTDDSAEVRWSMPVGGKKGKKGKKKRKGKVADDVDVAAGVFHVFVDYGTGFQKAYSGKGTTYMATDVEGDVVRFKVSFEDAQGVESAFSPTTTVSLRPEEEDEEEEEELIKDVPSGPSTIVMVAAAGAVVCAAAAVWFAATP